MIVKIVFALAAVIGLILAYAATRPGTFRVERSVLVNAAPARIFPLLNNMRASMGWSPFTKKDPNAELNYSGPAAGVGAKVSFAGNEEFGSGSVEITGARPDASVTSQLILHRPFDAANIVRFTLNAKGAATRVTWSTEGGVPYLAKLVQLVCSVDNMVGGDFEAGLTSLKTIAEKP